MKWDYKNETHPEIKKLRDYIKDKIMLDIDYFKKDGDNNDYYFFMVKLIYNTFITNHILTDGNKRMFKLEMEELNKKVSLESLE